MPLPPVRTTRRGTLVATLACLASLAVAACAPAGSPSASRPTTSQHAGAPESSPTRRAATAESGRPGSTDAEHASGDEPAAALTGRPIVAPPEPPPEMALADHVGAAAAAEHFVALIEHGLNTFDAAPMLEMCAPANGWCAAMAEQVDLTREESTASGVQVTNDAVVVGGGMQVGTYEDGTYFVGLTFENTATTTWTDAAGAAQSQVGEAGSLSLPMHLAHGESGWTVLAVG